MRTERQTDPFREAVIRLLNHIEDMVDDAPETVRLWNRVTAFYASEPKAREAEAPPVAWVPVHPLEGPLWANTTASPDRERLPSYPLMALYASPKDEAQPISDNTIREVFLANGFTIKEGLDDLKPYVYAAARALLATAGLSEPKAEAKPDDPEAHISAKFLDFDNLPKTLQRDRVALLEYVDSLLSKASEPTQGKA